MFRSATHICDPNDLLGGTALVQKMFSRSTDDIPDGYRRRTRQELEKLYENKASVRHGGADFLRASPRFCRGCGANALHPQDLTLRYSGRQSHPFFIILKRDEQKGRSTGRR